METVKGWKAFDHGLVCRGKQYAENTVFEEDSATICESGMHYCENPFDIMMYHDLVDGDGEIMDVAQVEDLDPEGGDKKTDGNASKSCTKELKIGGKVAFGDWLKAAVGFEYKKTEDSGYYARLASSGNYAQLASSGYSAQLASSGYSAQLASSGNYAQLASSGNYAQLASSGNSARLASSGNYAQLASSGNSARLASSGNSTQLASSGKHSVVAGVGIKNKAKASLGSWIVLAEWQDDGDHIIPVCVKAEQVDGEKIKADTFYKLEDGEFKEVES